MKAPQRRPIYIASLEAHIDALHAELLKVNLAPVNLQDVDLWAGLNSKIAKVSSPDNASAAILTVFFTEPRRRSTTRYLPNEVKVGFYSHVPSSPMHALTATILF